jgi:mannose-1-phosphate guanylyltransferase
MTERQESWAIVLAAGDGTRLASLTTNERGYTVPKQFCSLNGGPSLLRGALERAQRIVSRERVCAVVGRQHERHWRHDLRLLPAENVIVQPRNCGTANGVLLGLLHILERDPLARIVFLPADHYVHDEALLAGTVRTAARLVSGSWEGATLIGIKPDTIDPELGYIVPGELVDDGTRYVAQFVEKPTDAVARSLIARGAVWNTFIFCARATTLLALMRSRLPKVVEDMTTALVRRRRDDEGTRALDELYERLPMIDFSRTVVQGAESALRVSTAPACGWTDLGTPRSVILALRRFCLARAPSMIAPPAPASMANLSAWQSSEVSLGVRCHERLLITG